MFKTLPIMLLALTLNSTYLLSNPIDASINVIDKTNDTLKLKQNAINTLDEKNQLLLDEYKYTSKELENTRKYNEQLSKLINSQGDEIKDIDQQLVDIEETQKSIFPLMEEMIVSLEKLIFADAPFLLNERKQRIEKIKESIDRADIKTAEKFRILLEAFKIEYDYANSIEAYQEQIGDKTYTFLRIGRVGLYYQSLDLLEYGYWDKNNSSWIGVEDSIAKSNIRLGIKIAKNQQNVTLLELPFSTTKEQ
jgi:hypothetical protein